MSSQPSILVVEDDADIAALVELHLVDAGFAVTTESNGRRGLERALAGGWMYEGWVSLMWATNIPAGGRVQGVGGVEWYTDVDGHNAGDMPASVFVQLLATGGANPAPETVELSVPAGGTARWHDIYGSLFDFVGTGALRVLTDSPWVQIQSRTFADTGNGTYGQGIGPHTVADAVRFGEPKRLLELSQGTAFRTNLGFQNLTGMTTEVALELFDGNGVSVASQTVSLAAFEQLQLNRVFPTASTVGSATVAVTTPGGVVLTYGSVVDNATDDPTFIRAQ